MDIQSTGEWDESLWRKAEPIYDEAFPVDGRKPHRILRSMLDKRMCTLHVASEHNEAIAMAITGTLPRLNAMLIDYLAVRTDLRQQGIGRRFLERLRRWAIEDGHPDAHVVEIESEPTQTNLERLRFWQSSGFIATDYVHRYIWVPELYRALYAPLRPGENFPNDGQTLFKSIALFHQKSYSRA